MVPYAFVWEKCKTMDFSETIVVYDLKLATDDRSDKKFLLTSKLCPLGAVCPLLRGYIHVLNHEKKCIKSDFKRIGYNINIMRHSACLVFNPITVNNFASLFNCTPVGRASDSMMGPDIKLFILVGLGRSFFVCCLAHRGSTVGFLLLQCSSGVVRHPRDLQVSVATRFCRVLIFASS